MMQNRQFQHTLNFINIIISFSKTKDYGKQYIFTFGDYGTNHQGFL